MAEKEPKAAAELNVGEPAELVVVEVSEVGEVDEVGQDVDLLPSCDSAFHIYICACAEANDQTRVSFRGGKCDFCKKSFLRMSRQGSRYQRTPNASLFVRGLNLQTTYASRLMLRVMALVLISLSSVGMT